MHGVTGSDKHTHVSALIGGQREQRRLPVSIAHPPRRTQQMPLIQRMKIAAESFAVDMHMYFVFAAEEIEHKGCQRDNHCANECRKECFNLEVDTEILRQICSN